MITIVKVSAEQFISALISESLVNGQLINSRPIQISKRTRMVHSPSDSSPCVVKWLGCEFGCLNEDHFEFEDDEFVVPVSGVEEVEGCLSITGS